MLSPELISAKKVWKPLKWSIGRTTVGGEDLALQALEVHAPLPLEDVVGDPLVGGQGVAVDGGERRQVRSRRLALGLVIGVAEEVAEPVGVAQVAARGAPGADCASGSPRRCREQSWRAPGKRSRGASRPPRRREARPRSRRSRRAGLPAGRRSVSLRACGILSHFSLSRFPRERRGPPRSGGR